MISFPYLLITFLSIGQIKFCITQSDWAAHQDKTSFSEALQSLEEDGTTIDARAYGSSSALAQSSYGSSSTDGYGANANQRSTKVSAMKVATFRSPTAGKSGYGKRTSPPLSSTSLSNSYNQASGKASRPKSSDSSVYRTNGKSSVGRQSPGSSAKGSNTAYQSPASVAVAKSYGFATGSTASSSSGSKSSYGSQPSGSSGSGYGGQLRPGSGFGMATSGGSIKGRRGSSRPSFTETVTSLGPSTGSYGGNNVGSPMGDIDRRSFDFGGEKRDSYGNSGSGSASGQSYGSSSMSGSFSTSGNSYGGGSSMASGSSYGGQSSDTYGGSSSSDYGSDDGTDGLSVFGNPGVDFPIFSSVPDTGFSCTNRLPGYYADTGAGCQPFYICQADGRQDGFLCPNATLFNQEVFVCDWWFNVDCSMAESFYSLNGNLFQESGNSGYGSGQGSSGNSGYGSGQGSSGAGGSGYGSRTETDAGQVTDDYDAGSSGQGYGGSSGQGSSGSSGQGSSGSSGQGYGRGSGGSGTSGQGYGSGSQSSTESYRSSGSGLKRPSPSGQYDSPFRFGDTYNSDQGFNGNDGQVRMTGSGKRKGGQTYKRSK